MHVCIDLQVCRSMLFVYSFICIYIYIMHTVIFRFIYIRTYAGKPTAILGAEAGAAGPELAAAVTNAGGWMELSYGRGHRNWRSPVKGV